MPEYRLASYRDALGRSRAGAFISDRIYPVDALVPHAEDVDLTSVLGILASWDRVHGALRDAPAPSPEGGVALADAQLLAPILYPGAIFCSRGNYYDHHQEMAKIGGRAMPKRRETAEPFFTMKTSAHSVIGSGAPIHLPSFSQQLDWEAEIGLVIGRSVRNVSDAEAEKAIAGFVIVNDLSARDVMNRRRDGLPNLYDWFEQKCFADSAPMGPWLTPSEFVPDPRNMSIKLWVNGDLKQDGNSSNMVYSLGEQVAYLSRHITLRPGDVILTGCPSGVGMSTGTFLKRGDRVRIEVSHCGALENLVVAS